MNLLMNDTNRFGRNSKREVSASGTDAIWTADLVDMQSFSRSNKGFKYIEVCVCVRVCVLSPCPMIIDVFSKYEWAIPLKTKIGPEVMKAFQSLWKTQIPPQKIWTYKGKELYNKSMKELLEKNNVQLYSTEYEEKSSIVERSNRTIILITGPLTRICKSTMELSTRVRRIL